MKSLGESFLMIIPAEATSIGASLATVAWRTGSPNFVITLASNSMRPRLAHAHTGFAISHPVELEEFETLLAQVDEFEKLPMNWQERDVEKFLMQQFELDMADYRRFLELSRSPIRLPIEEERIRRKANVKDTLEHIQRCRMEVN